MTIKKSHLPNTWLYWVIPFNLILAHSISWLVFSLNRVDDGALVSTLIINTLPVLLVTHLWYILITSTKQLLRQEQKTDQTTPLNQQHIISLTLVYVGLIIVTHLLPGYIGALQGFAALSTEQLQGLTRIYPVIIYEFLVATLELLVGFWLLFRSSGLLMLERYARTGRCQKFEARNGFRILLWLALLYSIKAFMLFRLEWTLLGIVSLISYLGVFLIWALLLLSIYRVFPQPLEKNEGPTIPLQQIRAIAYIVAGVLILTYTLPYAALPYIARWPALMYYNGTLNLFSILLAVSFLSKVALGLWLVFKMGNLRGFVRHSRTV